MDMPLGQLGDEAMLVTTRTNQNLVGIAVVIQTAGASLLSAEEGGKAFSSLIETLNSE